MAATQNKLKQHFDFLILTSSLLQKVQFHCGSRDTYSADLTLDTDIKTWQNNIKTFEFENFSFICKAQIKNITDYEKAVIKLINDMLNNLNNSLSCKTIAEIDERLLDLRTIMVAIWTLHRHEFEMAAAYINDYTVGTNMRLVN